MPTLPPDTNDNDELRSLLSWSARMGFGPNFGTTTVAHYQNTHFKRMKGLGAIIGIFDPSDWWTGRKAEIRVRDGMIQYRKYTKRGEAPEPYTRWKNAVDADKFARWGKQAIYR